METFKNRNLHSICSGCHRILFSQNSPLAIHLAAAKGRGTFSCRVANLLQRRASSKDHHQLMKIVSLILGAALTLVSVTAIPNAIGVAQRAPVAHIPDDFLGTDTKELLKAIVDCKLSPDKPGEYVQVGAGQSELRCLFNEKIDKLELF